MSKIQFWALILLSIYSIAKAHSAVTQVQAVVDKNPVMVAESFVLEVTANGDVARGALDTSVLLQDFVVGRTSVSQQTRVVNGVTSRSTVWTTTLIPRQAGQFTIPALTVAGFSTQPINMTVLPVSANQQSSSNDIFITTEVDLDEVYLQQQIRYTVKLHLAAELQRGSLSQPQVRDADIEQVGNDKEYTEIIDGKRFRIIERVFSIIPNRSGEFVIQGPYFEGEVVDSNRQSFGFFNRTKTVSRVARNKDIKVLPMPEGYAHHWLPSAFVQLSEEWQMPDEAVEVGTPLTRTISLTAVGVVEEQLPQIGSQYPESLKDYPEQANTATVQRNGTFVAQRTETIALIPNAAGQLEIPEVSVPWFNVIKGETEFATLPARIIDVNQAVSQSTAPAPIVQEPAAHNAGNTISPMTLPVATPRWWSLSSWILLLCWLVTILLWLRAKKGESVAATPKAKATAQSEAWQALQQLLMQKQPNIAEVIRPLELWLAEYSGKPSDNLSASLRAIGNRELDALVKQMFAAQYHTSTTPWSAKPLLELLQKLKKQHRIDSQAQQATLQPLYPT